MQTSFYSEDELRDLGLHSFGKRVYISRRASLFSPGTISLGDNVRIDDFCILSGGARGIHLGSYIHIACYTALFGNAGIFIGDFAGISSRCAIYTYSDDYSGLTLTGPLVPDEYKTHSRVGPVTIGRHVIVGASSTILPGLTIGEGTAVGAHSLVSKSLDPWGVFVGVPARFVKARKKDLLLQEQQLLAKER